MNLHHPTPQPDAQTDPNLDALLDEALAVGDVPAELQARVLALTDPALNDQLDRALAPEAAPDGLQARVLERVQATLDEQERPVLARLGAGQPAWLGYAAAAAVVLVTGAAFYFVAGNAGPASTNTIADTTPGEETLDTEIEDALAFNDDTELDQRLSSLESRILSVSDEPIWGNDDDFQRELWRELAPEGEAEGLLF